MNAAPPPSHARKVAVTETGVDVDAELLAEAFGVAAAEIPQLMRAGAITSRLEKGVDRDAGRLRLVFFHGETRLTLVVDADGTVLQRSSVRLGPGTPPGLLRRR